MLIHLETVNYILLSFDQGRWYGRLLRIRELSSDTHGPLSDHHIHYPLLL